MQVRVARARHIGLPNNDHPTYNAIQQEQEQDYGTRQEISHKCAYKLTQNHPTPPN